MTDKTWNGRLNRSGLVEHMRNLSFLAVTFGVPCLCRASLLQIYFFDRFLAPFRHNADKRAQGAKFLNHKKNSWCAHNNCEFICNASHWVSAMRSKVPWLSIRWETWGKQVEEGGGRREDLFHKVRNAKESNRVPKAVTFFICWVASMLVVLGLFKMICEEWWMLLSALLEEQWRPNLPAALFCEATHLNRYLPT